MVVAAFTTRLRHSADFDSVRGDLVSAVHEAFQPAHISLWSAPGTSTGPRADAPRALVDLDRIEQSWPVPSGHIHA